MTKLCIINYVRMLIIIDDSLPNTIGHALEYTTKIAGCFNLCIEHSIIAMQYFTGFVKTLLPIPYSKL